MNQLRVIGAAMSALILMSGCVAYPAGYRDSDRGSYTRERERADCRDQRDCPRRDGDRRERDSDRRDDRNARP
jgi:hypothetical protein